MSRKDTSGDTENTIGNVCYSPLEFLLLRRDKLVLPELELGHLS